MRALTTNYRILTDATADLLPEVAREVDMIPMQLAIGGESLCYAGDWDAARRHAFYERLRAGDMPSTSQITPFAYEAAFSAPLSQGEDALYLCFSSGLSDTIASAQLALSEVKARFPERKFELIDTLSATYPQGMLVAEAVKNRARGMTLEENGAWILAHLQKIACWFTVSDLLYLRRGGRIPAATALLGTTLRIMPILHIDQAGKLPVMDKVRGRKGAMHALIKKMQQTLVDPAHQRVCVGHADSPEEAQALAEQVKSAFPALEDVFVGEISPIIGAHTGPGALCVVYFSDAR
ncbi:MAG: DegV family protein [Clostridia bacterium]